ncbi:hypothetical protein B296_00041364 [Ensete ventricosum]|uniref:Uncharacterized protein n=1 Tax=Ensete ventricosum TaxID=4639 RepID=A0A426YAI3_ENSVE|nr:hypothetical protein B296_00041364 [Ensete ventricosum]
MKSHATAPASAYVTTLPCKTKSKPASSAKPRVKGQQSARVECVLFGEGRTRLGVGRATPTPFDLPLPAGGCSPPYRGGTRDLGVG